MRLSFSLPGVPRPKARPRVTQYGTYTPKLTKEYENAVQLFAGIALGAAPGWRSDGEFRVECEFSFAKATLSDVDNLQKAVHDALEAAGVYDNDRQVVQTSAFKERGEDRTRVTVTRLGDAPARRKR